MISKELLSKVLNDKKILLSKNDLLIGDNVLLFDNQCNYLVNINIYELAHKCKEWAKLKYFIDIDSHSGCARWGAEAVSHNGRPSVFYEQVFIGRTETNAIFKACEWIMEQKQND